MGAVSVSSDRCAMNHLRCSHVYTAQRTIVRSVLSNLTHDGLEVRRTAKPIVRRTSSPSYFSGFFNLSISFVVNRFVLACDHVTGSDDSDIKGLNYP